MCRRWLTTRPRPTLTPEPLYHSPRGLFEFQGKGIAQWVLLRALLCTWETGTGKTHLTLAGGAMMFEDGLIDLLMVVCEQGKVPEWMEDFARFTDLTTARYMGSPTRRAKLRANPPQVLVTTYETSRNDLGGFTKVTENGRSKRVFVQGPLVDVWSFAAQGRGLAVVYDESTRLGNRYEAAGAVRGSWKPQRGSVVYKAHEAGLKAARKAGNVWVAGMTATPIERSPDNAFNQFRLLDPKRAGSIADYERDYVMYRDPFGKAKYKNIGPDDVHREPWVTPLSEKLAPIVSHKSKLDPDIRDAFPESTEEPLYVVLSKAHMALYDAVDALRDDPEVFPDGPDKSDEQVLFGILRQVAADPYALAISPAAAKPGTLAHTIVERVGADTLLGIGSAKTEVLVDKLGHLVKGQGAQVVVFSFFGNTIIPRLQERLTTEGFGVTPYTGSMSEAQKRNSKDDFRAGAFEVLLASDAGARGLNLPEAKYVVNYELCLTHAKTTQRINRVSRIDSGHAQVSSFSMVALDTIEESILGLNFVRQGWHESLLPADVPRTDDTAFAEESPVFGALTVDQRKLLFSRDRARSKR